jgi:hypothetical protein
MEQHVPLKYFRIRSTDPWRPVHAYQHFLYLTTPFTSFVIGAMRLDCAPWVFIAPLLNYLKLNRNTDSIAPAPQFFASGSNVDRSELQADEDGVGPKRFVIRDGHKDTIRSLILSNIIWLPLFFWTWSHHGFLQALLLNSVAFGSQAYFVTKSLLTQHLCEDVKLQPVYTADDDWYKLQVEASTTVHGQAWYMWLTYAISFQTEHHLFPSLNPKLLMELQPVIQQVCREFNVQYNDLKNFKVATDSVYGHFKQLSVKPKDA